MENERANVLFLREISPAGVVRLFNAFGKELKGKVAVKVHSGEAGNQNFLRPEFWRNIVERVGGTVVECNTAYHGARDTSEKHLKLIEEHGWNKFFDFDLLDKDPPDTTLRVPEGSTHLKYDIVGKNLLKYDSLLVLSHFKGHPMGGFGGALKQLSIGFASSAGKANIHSAGNYQDNSAPAAVWKHVAKQEDFLESMAEAAGAVVNAFKGKIVYINVMANMSVDCDCCAVAEDPCLKDIGMLISDDPVAIDRACVDLVKNCKDEGREHFMERVTSRNGEHAIAHAQKLGVGTTEYKLIEIE